MEYFFSVNANPINGSIWGFFSSPTKKSKFSWHNAEMVPDDNYDGVIQIPTKTSFN